MDNKMLRIKILSSLDAEKLENDINYFSQLVSECQGYITMVQYQTVCEPFCNNMNRGGTKYSVLIGYECDTDVNNLY